MVDPASVVAANLWIDHIAVFQSEVESVRIVGVVGGAFPRDAFARVFDDARALANKLNRVNAPTMHTGLANFDLYGRLSGSTFVCHTMCRIDLLCLRPCPCPILRLHR